MYNTLNIFIKYFVFVRGANKSLLTTHNKNVQLLKFLSDHPTRVIPVIPICGFDNRSVTRNFDLDDRYTPASVDRN